MNKTLVLLAFLVAGCTAPLLQTAPAGVPAEVSAPPIRAGDAWRYTAYDGYTHLPRGQFDYRVESVQDDMVKVERTHEGRASTELYTRNWAWRERPLTNLSDLRYQPAIPALPFPLHAGKTWRSDIQATDPATGRIYHVRVDGRVLGWERVRVPAGEFDALKVERRIYAGNFDFFKTEERIHEYDWYAPQVGAVVRHEGASEHTDTSLNCRHADCNIIRGDWIVFELAHVRRGSAGA